VAAKNDGAVQAKAPSKDTGVGCGTDSPLMDLKDHEIQANLDGKSLA